jgi:hypothetical protein
MMSFGGRPFARCCDSFTSGVVAANRHGNACSGAPPERLARPSYKMASADLEPDIADLAGIAAEGDEDVQFD